MRKILPLLFPITVACSVIACSGLSLHAQASFGFGAGVAAAGEDISRAGGELEDFLSDDTIEYGDVSGEIGFYGRAGMRLGLADAFRLTGDIAYIYFQNAEVVLTDFDVSDTVATATFEVGTSFIPISAGAEAVLPAGPIRLYGGAQATYTLVNRTYTYLRGSEIEEVENRSAGENEIGIGVGAGLEFAVGPLALDLGLRYTLSNLLSGEDGESSVNYLQIGLGLWIGGSSADDDSDGDDD